MRSVGRIALTVYKGQVYSANDVMQQGHNDYDPLSQYNSEMIVVSIGGLILNLTGLYLFHDDEDAESKN